jgi:arabinan endo-1,5-alpha-L-arabinosidase
MRTRHATAASVLLCAASCVDVPDGTEGEIDVDTSAAELECGPEAPELRLHYRFDSAAGGVIADMSGHGLDGVLRGAATITDAGRDGAALSLDGATGFVEIPAGATETLTEVTVTAWVNLDSTRAWSRIFDFGGTTGFLYLTPSTHDGFLRYSAFAGFGVESTLVAPALPTGAWKHVAVTVSGRDHRVYIDGVEAAYALTDPVTPSQIGASTAGNWIGRSRFPDPLLHGRIDDFRIYAGVLAPGAIAGLAHPRGDYAHWRFDERHGDDVRDRSDLDLDGDLRGDTRFADGVLDGAVRLDDGGHVRLPDSIVEDCTDLTVSAWVKLKSNPPWNRVFDFGKPDSTSFMYLSPAGFGPQGQELRFGLVTPVGIHDVGFPYVMPLNEWTHLAVTLRDQTASVYLNGRAVARRTDVISDPSHLGATTRNYVGKSSFAVDPPFDGTLDDMRLSCRAYSDTEIAQLAHLPAPDDLPDQLAVTGDVGDVHDPAIIKAGTTYHLFSTGPGIMMRRSTTLGAWTFAGRVFAEHPAWVTARFGAIDALWAPDVSRFGGTYHLYYSASTFGSNRSCIGHATKADLNSTAPWTDHGPVICSNDGTVDDWNAIDPNVIIDDAGTPWLAFGSFWGGLRMIKLTGAGARADAQLVAIARRPIETAIEAPFIVYRAPYYYLFASYDFCCRGTNSNYRIAVGRSTSVTGPYLDRTGRSLLDGGGTPVTTGGSGQWRGPGHNAVLKVGTKYLNVYHSYDARSNGRPTLRISELLWQEGWPVSAEP